MKSAVVAMLVLGSAAALAQQRCDDSDFALSTPTARFRDHGDGTVTDSASRLMWMRCSLGQTWSASSCVGSAERHSWPAAQAAASDVNRRGTHFFADWRLPQIRELATIAERECANPRINLAVFPNTPADFFWTATTRPLPSAVASAFALSFAADGVAYRDQDAALPVRLVRNNR
jgi:hypothetical protein